MQLPALSRPNPPTIDEPYDIHESHTQALPQRQQRQLPLYHNPPQPRPSSSSGSTRTLRRTPRFEQQRLSSAHTQGVAEPRPQPAPLRLAGRQRSIARAVQPLSEEDEGSSTPGVSRRPSTESSWWPQRTTHISKRTASAILYTLEEALRKPRDFTPDLIEENASMSNLAGGGPTAAPSGTGRAQNGGPQNALGPVPVPGESRSGVRTPTDIMRQRRDREAKRKAENESRQRQQDEEAQRQAQEEEILNTRRTSAAGVVPRVGSGEDGPSRRSRVVSDTRLAGTDPPPLQNTNDRRPGDRLSSSDARNNVPPVTQPAYQPSVYVPTANRTKKTPRVSDPDTGSYQPTPRPRATSVSQPSQPRPIQSSARATSATQRPTQAPQPSSVGAVNSQSQTRVNPSGDASAFQGGPTPRTRAQPLPEQSRSTQPRNPNASSFPHAFERWETLSSHWEGLTSYWIKRLEENSHELERDPIGQQLSRQVTDLSAAGANLFHAVVELQRLRASSERKFQRWFFETRAEQERAQEMHAGMEKALRQEREARAKAIAELSKVETEKNTSYQTKSTAEQMVKEMRRELEISKQEARRAWEELGRREQEERDRTTSLRAGKPTLVGGVQVVPMMQGGPSRQESTDRPSTREGPYPGGPNTASAQGETAEEDEPGYTTYDPTRSETDTDPFTESGRAAPQSEPELPPLPTTISQPPQQTPPTAPTTSQPPKDIVYPSLQQPTSQPPSSSNTSTYLRYGPAIPITQQPATQQSSFYQHESASLNPEDPDPRIHTEPDDRSYVTNDTLSEDDPELDENGEIRRPFQRRQGFGSEDSDEYDVQEALERERMYGQRYGTSSGIAGVEYGRGPTTAVSGSNNNGARPRPDAAGYGSGSAQQGAQAAPGGYDGSGYGPGWEAMPRHHHPTRLSDVLEEDERSRTSPSRASERSRGLR